jgi:hypothetical protein
LPHHHRRVVSSAINPSGFHPHSGKW